MRKKSVSLSLNDMEKELLEYALEEEFPGANMSLSSSIWCYMQSLIKGHLDIPEYVDVSVEFMHELMNRKYVEKQISIINRVGIKDYKENIEQWEKEGLDISEVCYKAINQYEEDNKVE